MMIGAGVLIGWYEDRIDLGCHDPFSITTALSDLKIFIINTTNL